MSLLYQFVKYSGRIGLPLYFGKLTINGKHNIPKTKPFIIAPNHQCAFLDAIMMGVYNNKPVHFLTRSDVFVSPFISALEALNMMPVYRIRDGYEKLSKNEEVFAECEDLLSRGMPVLIFPEGNMDEGHFLRPLTKGTARMAIQAQQNIDQDIMILPVGINYFRHYQPRYKCIINFGKALRVRDYMTLYNDHKAKGLIQLRDDLSVAIKKQLLIPEKEGYEQKVKALNVRTEKLKFDELKENIENDKFEIVKEKRGWPWIPKLLAVFNPLAIGVVDYLLSQVIKQQQFTSSLKYTLGLLLSVLWWTILFTSITLLFNYKLATTITLISIVMLFVRSDIQKYFHFN